MDVKMPNRRKFQVVHIWSCTAPPGPERYYTPALHAPNDRNSPPLKGPAPLELTPAHGRDSSRDYLEVGLVYGDDPKKYFGSNPVQKRQRAQRGVNAGEWNVLSVFTPMADELPVQVKYWVGIAAKNGRLEIRTIPARTVFLSGVPSRCDSRIDQEGSLHSIGGCMPGCSSTQPSRGSRGRGHAT
jgi:hypothetical protein